MKIRMVVLAFVFLPAISNAADYLWRVDKSTSIQMASVRNESGSETGIYCDVEADKCSAYLKTNIECTDGSTYPMMLNAAVGAVNLTALCVISSNKRIYLINEYGDSISAFESGGEIGFAFPMENGQYRVIRFTTRGATLAIKAARERPPSKVQRTPGDQVL